jgi:fibronectin type 3 domain-containing protein
MLPTSLYSQTSSIQVLTKVSKDGVWIRWAPSDDFAWQWGNRYGYSIERFTLLDNGDLNENERLLLTPTPVKPLPHDIFKDKEETLSDEVLAIGEILYAEGANVHPSILEQKQESENRYGMCMILCDLSRDAAKAAGLFLLDDHIEKGKRYIYRVKINDGKTTSEVRAGASIIRITDVIPLSTIQEVTATFKDRTVTLSWPVLLHKGIFSAYQIERSLDGKMFSKVSEFPYVHVENSDDETYSYYVDSLSSNQQTYYYRIAGITPFAERGPYSTVVEGKGKDDLTGYLILRKAEPLPDGRIDLQWEFPVQLENNIAGFQVFHSPLPDGPYVSLNEKLITKTKRQLEVSAAGYNTYYLVKALDKQLNVLTQSFPRLVHLEDNIPPVPPQNLSGNIDTLGIASLQWNSSTEEDLLGYRIFRSNELNGEFMERSRNIITTANFLDTVNTQTLNKKIYYKVVAVDKNYNTSGYSNPITLNKPDRIAPVPSPFLKTEILANGIKLRWIISPSSDVASYALSRSVKGSTRKEIIEQWMRGETIEELIDSNVQPGNTYRYHISFYDSAGNFSSTPSGYVFFEKAVKPKVEIINASIDRDKKIITLEWQRSNNTVKTLIYRKVNEEQMLLYETLQSGESSFIDKKIKPNNEYSYSVQLVFLGGSRSELPPPITVHY